MPLVCAGFLLFGNVTIYANAILYKTTIFFDFFNLALKKLCIMI